MTFLQAALAFFVALLSGAWAVFSTAHKYPDVYERHLSKWLGKVIGTASISAVAVVVTTAILQSYIGPFVMLEKRGEAGLVFSYALNSAFALVVFSLFVIAAQMVFDRVAREAKEDQAKKKSDDD